MLAFVELLNHNDDGRQHALQEAQLEDRLHSTCASQTRSKRTVRGSLERQHYGAEREISRKPNDGNYAKFNQLRRPVPLPSNLFNYVVVVVLLLVASDLQVRPIICASNKSTAATSQIGTNRIVITPAAFNGSQWRRQAQHAVRLATEPPTRDGPSAATRRMTSNELEAFNSTTTTTATTTTSKFRYHLNHLRPPALVPLTIQQARSPRPSPSARTTGDADQMLAAASSLQPQPQLVQLQVPLQLHLRLKPLPLPMPPPPQPAASSSPAQRADIKRRRSVLESTLAPSTTTTAATTPSVATERPTAASGPKPSARAANLHALTWHEAKRVLLLNAISPSLAQTVAKLERRTAAAQSAAAASPPATTSAPPEDTTPRHFQRHSAQQLRQEDAADGLLDEARVQSLAAAMLPFVWPSFQLTATTAAAAGGNHLRARSLDKSTLSRATWAVAAPQVGSNSLLAEPEAATVATGPAAASEFRPTFASADATFAPTATSTTTTTTTSTTRRPAGGEAVLRQQKLARKKRRRPNYLQQRPQDQVGLAASARPFPDSTRLASSYQLPKLKLSQKAAAQQLPQLPSDATTAAAPGLTRQAVGAHVPHTVQVPKSLSKLIEQQLLLNATTLLQQLKKSSAGAMLAPTTSVTKVVQLQQQPSSQSRNKTDERSWTSSSLVRISMSSAKSQDETERKQYALPVGSTTRPPQSVGFGQLQSLPQPTESSGERHTLRAPTTTTTAAPTTTIGATERTATQSVKIATTTAAPHLLLTSTAATSPALPAARLGGAAGQPASGNKAPLAEDATSGRAATVTATTTTTTTTTPLPQTGKPAKARAGKQSAVPRNGERAKKFGANNDNKQRTAKQADENNGKNIKLFHFKRKPDMNKLPFYKKPLNYTDLGWSNEQIQEHLRLEAARAAELEEEAAAAAVLGRNGKRRSLANSSGEGDDDSDAATAAEEAARAADGQTSGAAEQDSSLLLLKRKRRAKNHFERLMAEMQAAAAAAAYSSTTTAPPTEPTVGADADEDDNNNDAVEKDAANGAELDEAAPKNRVPALRKKHESLVMKPMFFVMNQKRRRQDSDDDTTSPPQAPPLQSVVAGRNISLAGAAGERHVASPTASPPHHPASSQQPIVRMRRKHHEASAGGEQQTPWRPTKPLWLAATGSGLPEAVAAPLVLVPSGLLTPSGSHPMPLFAETSAPAAPRPLAVETQGAWQSASSRPAATAATVAVAADVASAAAEPPGRQVQSLLASGAAANEQLKVPKLLVKPMRPAKYSLNGYIPKPSLGSQAALALSQQHQTVAGAVAQQAARSAAARVQQAQQPFAANNNKHSTGGQVSSYQSKDLDSSTSNEILSRRRGLQQHQRSPAAALASRGKQLSFDELARGAQQVSPTTNRTAPLAAWSGRPLDAPQAEQTSELFAQQPPQPKTNFTSQVSSGAINNNSLLLRQMEENKRKYVRQQQDSLRSPTLSAQKANQIKAKLGLLADGDASPRIVSPQSKRNKQQQSARDVFGDSSQAASGSANEPTHVEPPPSNELLPFDGAGQRLHDDFGAASQQQLIGAPLNTIPKTDFECTDKRGRFVSGLFADSKTGCQVWHLCSNNRKYSFLCPSGTIFSAKLRICDWRYNVKCENTMPH